MNIWKKADKKKNDATSHGKSIVRIVVLAGSRRPLAELKAKYEPLIGSTKLLLSIITSVPCAKCSMAAIILSRRKLRNDMALLMYGPFRLANNGRLAHEAVLLEYVEGRLGGLFSAGMPLGRPVGTELKWLGSTIVKF